MSVTGRIATVLRVRKVAERRALGRLAIADRDVHDAARVLAERRADHAARRLPAHPLSPAQLRALQLQGLGSLKLVEDAVADHDRSEERRAEVARVWALASVERRSAERLAERRAVEAAIAAGAAAQRSLDEAALLLRRLP